MQNENDGNIPPAQKSFKIYVSGFKIFVI